MPVNQEAQQRIVQKILENAPVDDSVRDQAWNAFFTAGDRVSFVQQFQSIPIPQSVKRQLWFAKFPEAYKKLPDDQRDLGDPELESFVRSGGKWIEAPLPDIINKEAARPKPSRIYTVDLGKLGIGKTPTEHIRPISEQEYRAGSKLESGREGLADRIADAIWGGYQIGLPGGVYEGMVSGWLKGLIGSKSRSAQDSGAKKTIPAVPGKKIEPRPTSTPEQTQAVAQPVEQVVLPQAAPPAQTPAVLTDSAPSSVQPESQVRSLVFIDQPASSQAAAPVYGPVPPPVPVQEAPKPVEVPRISLIPKFDKEVLDRVAKDVVERAKSGPKKKESFLEQLPGWIRSALETITGSIGPSAAVPEAGAPMVASGAIAARGGGKSAARPKSPSDTSAGMDRGSKASGGILDAVSDAVKGAIQSIASLPPIPESGVPLVVPKSKEEMRRIGQYYREALTSPVVPISEMFGDKPGYWRGVAKAVEPMLSPLGVMSAGVAAPVMAASPAAALALGSAGAVAASIGLGKKLRDAYEHVVAGRYDMAKEAAGEATVDGVFAVLMAHAAKRGAMDVYQDLLNRYRSWRATIVPSPKQTAKQLSPSSSPSEQPGVPPAGASPGPAGASGRPAVVAEGERVAAEAAKPVTEPAAQMAQPAAEARPVESVPPPPEEVERIAARIAAEIAPEEAGAFTEPPRPARRAVTEEPELAEMASPKREAAGPRVAVKERGEGIKEILGEQEPAPSKPPLDPEIRRVIENYQWMSGLDENTSSKILQYIDDFGEEALNGWKMVQVGERIVIGDPKSRQLVVFNSAEDALRYAKENPLVRPTETASSKAESRPARETAPETASAGPRTSERQERIMPEAQMAELPRPTAEAVADRVAPRAAGSVAAADMETRAAGSEMAQQEPPRERIRTAPSESAPESAGMPQLMPPSPSRTAGAGRRLVEYLASVLSDRNWPKEYESNTIYSSYRDLVNAIGESRAKDELAKRGVPQQVLDLIGDPDRLSEYARSSREALSVGRRQREVAMQGIPTAGDLAGDVLNDRIATYVKNAAYGASPVDEVLFWDAGLAVARNRQGKYDLYSIEPETGLMRYERTFDTFDSARSAAASEYSGRRIDASAADRAVRAIRAGADEFQRAQEMRPRAGQAPVALLQDTSGIAYHGNFGYSVKSGEVKLFVRDDNGDVIYQTRDLPENLKNLIVVRDGLAQRLDYEMLPAILSDSRVNFEQAYNQRYASNAERVSQLARRSLSDLYYGRHGVHLGPQFEVDSPAGKRTISFAAPMSLQNVVDGYVSVELDGQPARTGVVSSRDALREALYDALVEAGGNPDLVRGLTPEARAILNKEPLVSDLARRAMEAAGASKSAEPMPSEERIGEEVSPSPAPELAPSGSTAARPAPVPEAVSAQESVPAPETSEPPRPSLTAQRREQATEPAPAPSSVARTSEANAQVRPEPSTTAGPSPSSEPPRPSLEPKAESEPGRQSAMERGGVGIMAEPPKPKSVASAERKKAVEAIAEKSVEFHWRNADDALRNLEILKSAFQSSQSDVGGKGNEQYFPNDREIIHVRAIPLGGRNDGLEKTYAIQVLDLKDWMWRTVAIRDLHEGDVVNRIVSIAQNSQGKQEVIGNVDVNIPTYQYLVRFLGSDGIREIQSLIDEGYVRADVDGIYNLSKNEADKMAKDLAAVIMDRRWPDYFSADDLKRAYSLIRDALGENEADKALVDGGADLNSIDTLKSPYGLNDYTRRYSSFVFESSTKDRILSKGLPSAEELAGSSITKAIRDYINASFYGLFPVEDVVLWNSGIAVVKSSRASYRVAHVNPRTGLLEVTNTHTNVNDAKNEAQNLYENQRLDLDEAQKVIENIENGAREHRDLLSSPSPAKEVYQKWINDTQDIVWSGNFGYAVADGLVRVYVKDNSGDVIYITMPLEKKDLSMLASKKTLGYSIDPDKLPALLLNDAGIRYRSSDTVTPEVIRKVSELAEKNIAEWYRKKFGFTIGNHFSVETPYGTAIVSIDIRKEAHSLTRGSVRVSAYPFGQYDKGSVDPKDAMSEALNVALSFANGDVSIVKPLTDEARKALAEIDHLRKASSGKIIAESKDDIKNFWEIISKLDKYFEYHHYLSNTSEGAFIVSFRSARLRPFDTLIAVKVSGQPVKGLLSVNISPLNIKEFLSEISEGGVDVKANGKLPVKYLASKNYPTSLLDDVKEDIIKADQMPSKVDLSSAAAMSASVPMKDLAEKLAILYEDGSFGYSDSVSSIVLAGNADIKDMDGSTRTIYGSAEHLRAFSDLWRSANVDYSKGLIVSGGVALNFSLRKFESVKKNIVPGKYEVSASVSFVADDLREAVKKMGKIANFVYWFEIKNGKLYIIRAKPNSKKMEHTVAGKAGAGIVTIPADVASAKVPEVSGYVDGTILSIFVDSVKPGSTVNLEFFGDKYHRMLFSADAADSINRRRVFLASTGHQADSIRLEGVPKDRTDVVQVVAKPKSPRGSRKSSTKVERQSSVASETDSQLQGQPQSQPPVQTPPQGQPQAQLPVQPSIQTQPKTQAQPQTEPRPQASETLPEDAKGRKPSAEIGIQEQKDIHVAKTEPASPAVRAGNEALRVLRGIMQEVGIDKDKWYSLYESGNTLLFAVSPSKSSLSYELSYVAKIADLPPGVDVEYGAIKPDRAMEFIEKVSTGELDATDSKSIRGYLGVSGRYATANRAALEVLTGAKPRGDEISLAPILKLAGSLAYRMSPDYRAVIVEGGHYGFGAGNVSGGGLVLATNASADVLPSARRAFIGDLKGLFALAKFGNDFRINYSDGVISSLDLAAAGDVKHGTSIIWSRNLNSEDAPVSISFSAEDLKKAVNKMGPFAGYQFWLVPLNDRLVVVRTKFDIRKQGYYAAGRAGAGMLAIPAKVEWRKQGDYRGLVDGSALMSFLNSAKYDADVHLSIFGDDYGGILMNTAPKSDFGFNNIYLLGGGVSAAKYQIRGLDRGYGAAMLIEARASEPAMMPRQEPVSSSEAGATLGGEQAAGTPLGETPRISAEPQPQTQPEIALKSEAGPVAAPETGAAETKYSEPPRPSSKEQVRPESSSEVVPEKTAEGATQYKKEEVPEKPSGAKEASASEPSPAPSEPPRPRQEKASGAKPEQAAKPDALGQKPDQKVKISDKLKNESAKAIARMAEESDALPHDKRVGEHSPEYATFRKRLAKAVDYISSHPSQFETASKIRDLDQWMAFESLIEKAYRSYVERRFKDTMSPIELEYQTRMMRVFPGIEDYVSADMLTPAQLSKIGEEFHPHTSTLKSAVADILKAFDRVGSSVADPIPLRIDDLDKAWRQKAKDSDTSALPDRPPEEAAMEDGGQTSMGLSKDAVLVRPQVTYWPRRMTYPEAWAVRLPYEQRIAVQRSGIADAILNVLNGRDYYSKKDPDNAGYFFYNRRAAEWFADYVAGDASYDDFVSIIDGIYGGSHPALIDLLSSESLAGYYKFRKVNYISSTEEKKYSKSIVVNVVKNAGVRTLHVVSLLAKALGGSDVSEGVYRFTNNEQNAKRFMNILETGMVPQEVLAYAASFALASKKEKLIDALVSQIHSPAKDDSGEAAWSGKGRVVAEIKDDRISKAIVQSCGSDWTPVGVEEIAKRYPDLLSYQADGVARAIYALDKYGGFLLMDGAGAGKTSQIMAVAKHYLDQGKKVVLISRANALKIRKTKDGAQLTGSYAEWAQRIKVPVHVVASPDQVPKELQPGKLYVGNYSHYSLNKKYPVDKDTILILDEAHALKNFDSNATLNAMPNIDDAGAVMYATATPIDQPQHIHYLKRIDIYEGNDPDTALTKLGLVRRMRAIKRGDKIEAIVEWAANPALSPSQIASRLDALFWRLGERGLVLRREISLRGVDVYMRQVDLPEEAKNVMDKIEAAFASAESPSAAALVMMHQRRQLETYKVDDVVKITKDELAAGRNVVIFASRINTSEVAVKYVEVNHRTGERVEYKDVIHVSEGTTKLIKDALIRDKVVKESEIVEVHGNAEGKQSDAIDLFQSNKAKVLIATVESGGVGINLDDTTGARPRTMIVMTPPFDAVNNIQAICRVWRVNTKSYPKVYYLRGDHKVDNWNFDIIAKKMKYLHAAVKNELKRVDIDSKDVMRAEELSARAREERVMNDLLLYRGWPYEVSDIRMITDLSDLSEDELEKTIIALAKRGLLKLIDGVKEKPSDENRHKYVYDEDSGTYYRRVIPNVEMLKSSK